jgi:hypothetical protein
MDKIPYWAQLALAQMLQDKKLMEKIVSQGLDEVSNKVIDIAMSYDGRDLPLVVAAIEVAARVLKSTLSESDQKFATHLAECVITVAVDADEIEKQKGEEQNENKT